MTTSNHARYTPSRVMAIFAHPDDIEFSASGTIARWVKDGAVARYVVLTSGQVGIKNADITPEAAGEIREREQREAARVTGVDDVIFLGYQDGLLENTLTLRHQLVREIRRFRPEVLITGDPTAYFVSESYINHPDHRAAAAAALDAVFPAAGMPTLYKDLEAEGLTAHETRKVYITSWEKADTWVDISETIDVKIAALQAHASQMGDWDPSERVRNWAARTAKGHEMAYAEAYRVITLKSDEDWARCQGNVLPEQCKEPESVAEAAAKSG